MVVQHNLTAMNANRMLNITTGLQAKATEKLSSGYQINRAADNAAGLSISEKMRKQIRGLTQASTNAQDGISAVQTAEGALAEVHDMLQRMNELAVQASNGTNAESDRQSIQDEVDQLTTEIDRVSETTKFNEIYLLKGDPSGSTSTQNLKAHDAGLDGKLSDNGDGTTSFKLNKALEVGDKVKIAGTQYTIANSSDTSDYKKIGSHQPAAAGDSVTSNGVTTTIVDKVTTTNAQGATWAANDTFVDADGKSWKVIADTGVTDSDKGEVKISDVSKYLKEGSTITANAAAASLNGLKVVDNLASTEVSSADTAGITALKNGIKAGDTVTVSGERKEITAETPTSMDDIASAIDTAGNGKTVAIGSKTYTLGISTDSTNGTITKDDFLSLIKHGDTVTVNTTKYTAIGNGDNDSSTITAKEAYQKMATELGKASSIGADTDATVKNNGDGSFVITQGTVEVKDKLSFNLHVGADADMTNKITVDIDTMGAAKLGVKGINLKDASGAEATYAIDAIADAVSTVSAQRSALGAVQNRLEHTIKNLDNIAENTTSAESSIRDTDMAKQMVSYSNNNILAQAGQSMLAQANQSNQGVLSLLG